MQNNRKELSPDEWVARYADYLLNIAMYKVSDLNLAKDLVQETFLSALKGKEGFQGLSSEKTWLTSILSNKIADHYRKKKSGHPVEEYLSVTSHGFNNSFFDSSEDKTGHMHRSMMASDWGYDADRKINEKEFSGILADCISGIPPKISGIFLSKYFEEKKAGEICNEFNITTSNYWVIIHRAKLLLRQCLEKNWFLRKDN
jgi:RNA polymerase sigma-70 factor (ECF subfamily)